MADSVARRQKTEDGRQMRCSCIAAPVILPRSGRRASVLCYLSSILCLLSPVTCSAEELTDPTRPPESVVATPVSGVAAVKSAGLQSIIISKIRRAAIIDGQTVELGGKYNDAKLVEVNEGSIVLAGVQGRQVMTLFPGVKMTTDKRGGGKSLGTAKVSPGNETAGRRLKTRPHSANSKVQKAHPEDSGERR